MLIFIILLFEYIYTHLKTGSRKVSFDTRWWIQLIRSCLAYTLRLPVWVLLFTNFRISLLIDLDKIITKTKFVKSFLQLKKLIVKCLFSSQKFGSVTSILLLWHICFVSCAILLPSGSNVCSDSCCYFCSLFHFIVTSFVSERWYNFHRYWIIFYFPIIVQSFKFVVINSNDICAYQSRPYYM